MSSLDAGDVFAFANNQVCQDLPTPTGCLSVFLKSIPQPLLDEALGFTDDLLSAAQGPLTSVIDQISALEQKALDITNAIALKNSLLSTLDDLVTRATTFLAEGLPCVELEFLLEMWNGLRSTVASALERLDKVRQEIADQVAILNAAQQVLDCANSNFQQAKGILEQVGAKATL